MKILSYYEMVELYENGKKEKLPESFINYYEKGYGDLLTDEFVKYLLIPSEDKIVTNPYSGVKVKLNPTEFALYDCLMGIEEIFELADISCKDKLIQYHSEIKSWFRWNSDCYMNLID